MARWTRKRRYVSGAIRIPQGFSGELRNEFRQRLARFNTLHGKKATLTNIGGEGSPRYELVEEKGNHEDDAEIDKKRTAKYVLLPARPAFRHRASTTERWSTLTNWFECMRSRQQPSLHGAGWVRALGG